MLQNLGRNTYLAARVASHGALRSTYSVTRPSAEACLVREPELWKETRLDLNGYLRICPMDRIVRMGRWGSPNGRVLCANDLEEPLFNVFASAESAVSQGIPPAVDEGFRVICAKCYCPTLALARIRDELHPLPWEQRDWYRACERQCTITSYSTLAIEALKIFYLSVAPSTCPLGPFVIL